jgi:hypothetical protein
MCASIARVSAEHASPPSTSPIGSRAPLDVHSTVHIRIPHARWGFDREFGVCFGRGRGYSRKRLAARFPLRRSKREGSHVTHASGGMASNLEWVGKPETASHPATVRYAGGDRARSALVEDRRDNVMGGPGQPGTDTGAPRGGNLRRGSPTEAGSNRGRTGDLREEQGLEVEAELRGSRRKSVSGAESTARRQWPATSRHRFVEGSNP